MKFLTVIFLCTTSLVLAQPWDYNFGTGTGSHTSGESTTFLPAPSTGTARVRVGTGGGSLNLDNPGIIGFGTESEFRGLASSSGSVNKFSLQTYTAGKSFTIKMSIRLDGGTDGTWYFFQGSGLSFTNNSAFTGADIFSGIRWVFGASSTITTSYRNGGGWSALGSTPFTQATNYIVEIYGNNTTATQNYTYGTAQSVGVNKWDIWIDGVLVGNDLAKALLADDTNIDSFMFYGENSSSNLAKIYIEDITFTNSIASTPLPVELSSFSASIIKDGVKLNWRTETEVNNYGFEIERKAGSEQSTVGSYEKIGFVSGSINSNSPKDYSFVDDNILIDKCSYRLKQIDTDGTFTYSKVIEVDLNTPVTFKLNQNYPNPFNPSTTIVFSLASAASVKLTVYNILGQEVALLVDEFKPAGRYEIEFNANELSDGVYFYQLKSGSQKGQAFVETKKMILLK